MENFEQRFLNSLKSGKESAICKYLALNPEILRWTVCKTGGHTTYMLKEFPFGSRFRADFVVATSYSGAWDVHLIELEPPGDAVITKKGLPSNRLNTALSQLKDWKSYIDSNSTSFKQDLANWCKSKDLLKINSDNVITNYTGNHLNLPETCIWFRYHIFIGKRENMDDFKYSKINQNRTNNLEIHTYGRIQDIARNFDDHESNPLRHMQITKTNGL